MQKGKEDWLKEHAGFHGTPIVSNTAGKLFNISMVTKGRVARREGGGVRRVGLPSLIFPYLVASVASMQREGEMELKLI